MACSDQNLCNTNVTTLAGNDPSVGFGTGQWIVVSGSASFADPTLFNTGVTSGNALVGGLAFWNNTIGGSNVDAMRLKDNGDAIFEYNVGIGTVNPGTTLHVYNSTANGVATFESGDAQGGIFVLLADTTDATATVLTTNNSTASTDNQIVAASDSPPNKQGNQMYA